VDFSQAEFRGPLVERAAAGTGTRGARSQKGQPGKVAISHHRDKIEEFLRGPKDAGRVSYRPEPSSLRGGNAVPLRDIDRKLIDRCLRKEPGAWNDFVDRYVGLIYHVIQHVAYARSRTLSVEDVEDIASEVFLKIVDDNYAILKKFKGLSSLPTYLTVICRRISTKELIKRHHQEELGHTNAHRAFVDDGASGEIEAILSAEEVDRLLEELPDREAQVVRLYHLKFLNYRQIGKRLGITENSVGPILAKARKRLREVAEEQRSAS
jgi:RNA polymerase sigma-70 factor (ECF subfamily)